MDKGGIVLKIDISSIEEHLGKLKKQFEEQKAAAIMTQGAIMLAETLLSEASDENQIHKSNGEGINNVP